MGLCFKAHQALCQEFQGKFANWSVFTTDFGKKKICYMLATPTKERGNYFQRDRAYFLVVNSTSNIDEVNISSGFEYKKGSEVELSFGHSKYSLFTYENLAWAHNKVDDIEILKLLRNNLDVIVIAKNKQNRFAHDTYSLVGFNKAYQFMKNMCDEFHSKN